MKPLSFLLSIPVILFTLSEPAHAQNRGGFAPTQPTSRQAGARPVGSSQPTGMLPSDVAAIRIGVRGGVTNPYFLENQGAEAEFGYVAGVMAQFGRGTVSFQPEVNLSQFGFSTSIPFLGSINARFTQIEVPLLLKFSSGQATGNRIFFNVGPYGSYLYRATNNGVKQDLDGLLDTRFSVGAAAGLGAALKAGPGHLTVELRGLYTLGTTEEINTDSRVIVAQGTVGYMIPLGGQ
ncbi:porin family protein [Fibrisoma montanum]|nr:porin family protein [Fibrisoma montanum]